MRVSACDQTFRNVLTALASAGAELCCASIFPLGEDLCAWLLQALVRSRAPLKLGAGLDGIGPDCIRSKCSRFESC